MALALILLGACATPGAVITSDVAGMRSGALATQEQARLAFDAANKMARDQSVERKVTDPSLNLREVDFPTPVAREDAQSWTAAFSVIDAYFAALQKLVAPEGANATGAALVGLAAQLNSGSTHAAIPPSVSGVFASFAQALVQAHSEHTATAVMRKTDGAFREVMLGMASAIGNDPSQADTLQFVVDSKWDAILATITANYSALPPSDTTKRRLVIKQFTAALESRDEQLASLDQLNASLLALAEAHSAAAKGKPGDAMFWIQRINTQLDDVKRRVEAAQKAQKGMP